MRLVNSEDLKGKHQPVESAIGEFEDWTDSTFFFGIHSRGVHSILITMIQYAKEGNGKFQEPGGRQMDFLSVDPGALMWLSAVNLY